MPGYLGKPVSFFFIPLYIFTTLIIFISGNHIEFLEVDEREPDSQQRHDNYFTEDILIEVNGEVKPKTCVDYSFHYPLQCIKSGCRLNALTRECRDDYSHAKRRVKRDSKSKCFHFDKSPHICQFHGCKYDSERHKCLNQDGSDDSDVVTKRESKEKYKFMEKPTPSTCKQYHGKPLACGYAGCLFDKWSHRCLLGSDKSSGDEESAETQKCVSHNGSKDDCRNAGCLYDKSAKKCSKGPQPVNSRSAATCNQFNSDKSNCMKSGSGCLYNENSENCIEAKEPLPGGSGKDSTGEHPKKYCDFLYGKKKNCEKAGCLHDKINKKCDAGMQVNTLEESDTVTITYVETKPENMKKTVKECSELDISPRGCLFAGCKYNEETNKCNVGPGGVISFGTDKSEAEIASKYLFAEECSKLNGNESPCSMAGCQYVDDDDTCVSGKREPSKGLCESLDNKPVQCIKDSCLYDGRHKKCFVSDFHETSYTIHYVRVTTKRTRLVAEECSELDGSPSGCNYAGCKYDEGKNKCLERTDGDGPAVQKGPLSSKECSKLDDKLRACGYAGCRYKTKDHKCIVNTEEKTGCGVLTGDKVSCKEAGCIYDKKEQSCKDAPVEGTKSESKLVSTTPVATTTTKVIVTTPEPKVIEVPATTEAEEEEEEVISTTTQAENDESEGCAINYGLREKCKKAGCDYDDILRSCSVKVASVSTPPTKSRQLTPEICANYHKNPKSCGAAGCQFIIKSKECLVMHKDSSANTGGSSSSKNSKPDKDKKSSEESSESVDCDVHDGKKKSCLKAPGCSYDEDSKKCSETPEIGKEPVKDDEDSDKSATKSECREMDGSPKACEFMECLYDEASSKCVKELSELKEKSGDDNDKSEEVKDDSQICVKFDAKPDKCTDAGCSYDKGTKKCTSLQGTDSESSKELEEHTILPIEKTTQSWLEEEFTMMPPDDEEDEEIIEKTTIKTTTSTKTGKTKRLNATQCAKLNTYKHACKYAGCRYSLDSDKCLEGNDDTPRGTGKPLTNKECSKFSENLKPCKYAGCRYMTKTKKCKAAKKGASDDEKLPPELKCKELDRSAPGCAFAGCKYDETKKKCFQGTGTKSKKVPLTKKECSVLDDQPIGCGLAGCKHIKQQKISQCTTGKKDASENKKKTKKEKSKKEKMKSKKRPLTSEESNSLIAIYFGRSLRQTECDKYETEGDCGKGGCTWHMENKTCKAKEINDKCTQHNGDPDACEGSSSGCNYIVSEKMCLSSIECSAFDGSESDCTAVPHCRYDVDSNKCMEQEKDDSTSQTFFPTTTS